MFNLDPETRREFQQNYKAAIAIGILMIVLGALAIFYPLFATVFTFNVIGFVLLLFGILQLAYAFQTRNNPVGHFILNLLIGIFYLIVGIILGILIWSNWPFDSLVLLGLLVGINLITTGVSLLLFFRAAKQSLGTGEAEVTPVAEP